MFFQARKGAFVRPEPNGDRPIADGFGVYRGVPGLHRGRFSGFETGVRLVCQCLPVWQEGQRRVSAVPLFQVLPVVRFL